jgi:signal transduction histidine kinase
MRHSLNWGLMGTLLLVGGLCLAYHFIRLTDPPGREPVAIRQGEIRLVECGNPHQVIREWQPVTLPYWEQQSDTILKCYQFRSSVRAKDIPLDAVPSKLVIYNIGSISHVSLNGMMLDELRHTTKSVYITAHTPYEIFLPRALWRSENEFFYEAITKKPYVHIGVAFVGTEPVMTHLYRSVTFLAVTILDGVKVLCLMLGFMFLSFRVLFPQERLIGLTGGTMLFMGLCYSLVNLVEYPASWHYPILATQYLSACLVCFFYTDFIFEIAELGKGKFHRVVRLVTLCFGPVTLLAHPHETSVVFLNFYLTGFLILYFLSMFLYSMRYGTIMRKADGRLFLLQTQFIFIAAVHDYCTINGLLGVVRQAVPNPSVPDLLFENYFLTLYGLMPVIFIMLEIVINQYRTNRDYMQNEAVRVASALRQSEIRLREVVKKQHDIRNIKLIQQERERLLMEIHDGVGSQLIAGMLLAQKEGLQKQAVLDMIQGCIDDVRVIIDCISMAERANALEIFSKLVERLRPRLESIGIRLTYQSQARFAEDGDISDVQCLHASRIIQECITNAIKHATCREILVSVRQYRAHLMIVVRDDGGGVDDVDQLNLGRGLKNMRKRARLLGGHIKFQNYKGGFTVMLRFRNRPSEDQRQAVRAA